MIPGVDLDRGQRDQVQQQNKWDFRFLIAWERSILAGEPTPRCRMIVDEVEVVARMFVAEPLRITKIYEKISVSPGMIRLAFRMVHGCSPRRFLRDQRLRTVHAELHSALPGMTVTQIATRHGFIELGRFAT